MRESIEIVGSSIVIGTFIYFLNILFFALWGDYEKEYPKLG